MSTSAPHIYTTAIVGAGRAGDETGQKGGGHQIGYTHAAMYQRNPRVRLAAVADINPTNLSAFQHRFNVTDGFADYQTLFETVRPDIVSICTYVGLHRPIIEAAAHAGVKAIICEKPFLNAPADIPAIREVVAATGVKIVVTHIRRYRPAFVRVRELYMSGVVGKPIACLAGIEGWDLSEWGSHWLDMFRFFHGDQQAAWVFGQARVRDTRGYGHAMEDHAVAYIGFPNGARAILDGGMGLNATARQGMDSSMVLLGTAGSIRVLGEEGLIVEDASGQREEWFTDHPQNDWPALWDCLLADLIAWADGGSEPMLGLQNMLLTSELNLAAYLSAVQGDRIDLPLDYTLTEWPVEVLARRKLP